MGCKGQATRRGLGRRAFLRSTAAGALAAAAGAHLLRAAPADQRPAPSGRAASPTVSTGPSGAPRRVALTAGEDRAENVFRGLDVFRGQIAEAIGTRRVVIKPNNVSIDRQLAATHAECLEAILEFLRAIGKLEGAVIAESAATGPTMEGFSNFGYPSVAERYGVKLIDLDRLPTHTLFVFDEKDLRPHPMRASRMLLDHEHHYVISAAMPKTHDRAVATLSLKNIVFGAPVKDLGFRFGPDRAPGTTTQKPIAHGSGFYGINYNLFALAERLYPDLAVIDGYQGMEGNGPTAGRPVEHRVCVVSPDWLAADRVAVELMGIDFAKVGYLNYLGQARPHSTDLEKIELVGEPLRRHVRRYRLHENVEKQLIWMTPREPA